MKALILSHFHTREFRERRNDLRIGSVKEGVTMKGSGNGKHTILEKLNLSFEFTAKWISQSMYLGFLTGKHMSHLPIIAHRIVQGNRSESTNKL